MSSRPRLELPPGFRFHPTDEELVVHYLSRRAACRPFPIPIIAEIDLYKFDPWDLPQKALFGEREWYFFSSRERKYPNGVRPNRAAASGYWKATGTDKPILSNDRVGLIKRVGVKKALVFYEGRAPAGVKTDWIMHEYRLLSDSSLEASSIASSSDLRLDECVLCRIYKKTRSYNPCISAAKASPNVEIEEESCLEQMLASLPNIENDSKLFFPRLGSSNATVYSYIQQENQTMADSFSTEPDYRNTINKNSAPIHYPHGETHPHYSDTRCKNIHADSDAKLTGDHVSSMQTREWRDDPCSESMNEMTIDAVQSIIKKKMKLHTLKELDEGQQSVCSPSSASTCIQQENVDQQQNLHTTTPNSSIHSLHMAFHDLPYSQQSHNITTPIRLETCECHFPRLNGFYVQSYS